MDPSAAADAATDAAKKTRDVLVGQEGKLEFVAGAADFMNPMKRVPVVGKHFSIKRNLKKGLNVIKTDEQRAADDDE